MNEITEVSEEDRGDRGDRLCGASQIPVPVNAVYILTLIRYRLNYYILLFSNSLVKGVHF